jgi:arabinofuranan 3-O-arabinosyltransferase
MSQTPISHAITGLSTGGQVQKSPRVLGIFAGWRLQAYGYSFAALYAFSFLLAYIWGIWPVDNTGTRVLFDFTEFWIAGTQALHGEASLVYDPLQFMEIQAAVAGPAAFNGAYPVLPYPPIFFLIMTPLAMLPFVVAFLTFNFATLLGYLGTVFLIVRRQPSIALVLASPFSVLNFLQGQTGFLRASLVGAALLTLERQPLLAGIFIGCLAYKPQLGVLFPVALVAARQWRAFISAGTTVTVLAGLSVACFGISPWESFLPALFAYADTIFGEVPPKWTYHQTVYGLVSFLHGNATLAWFAQTCTAAGVAVIVWLVWRSPMRYSLKAAMLSAATLLATPYGWACDFTVIGITLAYLVKDQIQWGLLIGEQTIFVALVAAGLAMLVGLGSPPLGPVMIIALIGIILRRAFRDRSAAGWPVAIPTA